MSKAKIKQLQRLLIGLLITAVFGSLASFALATTLNSTNFKVMDYDFGFGGSDKTTSTNYQMQPNIDLVLDVTRYVAPPPPPPPPPPVSISNVQAINITGTTATITWTTNVAADSKVEYGFTTSYGDTVTSSTYVTSHSIPLTGLVPNSTYHYRVTSDAGTSQATSADYTFVTTDTIPPVISNVQVINITENSATITWTTDENSDSYVDYGLTTSYGSSSSSAVMTVSHSITIINLTRNTLYHFRVKSKDAANNEATSGDFTFTTLDLTPPVISNIRVENITGTSAVILWDTDEPATSVVAYGLGINYGTTSTDNNLVTSHSVPVSGLTPDTLYHFKVLSADSKNNIAQSGDNSFRTLDTIPPVISNIQVINITSSKAEVTWVTNEPTTSQVFYRRVGESSWSEAADGSLQVSHSQSLNGLIANVDYEFYIVAKDAAGNTATSPIGTFHTLRDNVSPSNIRNFIATPDDKLNVLTWQESPDPDYLGVMIVRSTSTYPRNRFEGDIIYVGPGISYNDTGLINGVKYYYTGFAFDTSFNYASGAITDGTPFGPEGPPPPPPPPPPPTPVNLDAVTFWVAKRTIQIQADSNGIVETLAGIELGISVDKSKIPQDVQLITLRIDTSNYLLKERLDKTMYDADVFLPQNPAIYDGIITLVLEDSQQQISFKLDLRSRGMIFETIDGASRALAGAEVTLYELKGGDWVAWQADRFFQINPKVTLSDGLYSFLVPNGTYHLEIKKDEYRDRSTNRFTVERNYINESFELLRLPKKITEVIKPEESITKNVVNVTKAVGEQTAYQAKVVQEQVINFAQSPVVENINTSVAAPTLVSVAVINVATALPFLNIFGYLQYLLTQPLLFFLRRKRKAWGVVYNAFTKLPLDLAIVRLVDAKLKRVIRTVVTDKQGRYLLFAPHGNYTMDSTKAGFIFPSAYLKGKKEDEAYSELYFGTQFDVKQDGQVVTFNVPMDPVDKKEVSVRRMMWERALKGAQYGLSLSGVALTAVSFIISPSIKIGLFLVLHIALFGLFVRLGRPIKFKKWGVATDAATGQPVKNAIVRLFEPEYNKLLGTQITDARGRYAFLVGRNVYYLTFERAGYKTLKTKNIDTRTKAKSGVITEKVKMEPEKSKKIESRK